MGSTAILTSAVALATALIGLLLGFLWGRSNLKAQIADALDRARASKDVREFELLEQLSNKMLEINELRARSEELPRSQEQLEHMPSSTLNNSSSGSAAPEVTPGITANRHPEQKQGVPTASAAEKTAQVSLNPKAEKPKQPNEIQDVLPEKSSMLPVTKFPVRFPSTFAPQNTTPESAKSPAVEPVPATSPAVRPHSAASPPVQPLPAKSPAARPHSAASPAVQSLPAKSPAARPRPAVNNEDWDEFAKSLEALKKLQK
jgi:hypothetical protein